MKFVSSCVLAGDLYKIKENNEVYPALVPGRGRVEAELYELKDAAQTLKKLDDYESFNPANPSRSLFIRRPVLLKNPHIKIWVYFYNGDVSSKPRISEWPEPKS